MNDKKRADLYRLARDLIREKFDDDPIADACDDRIKQLDPPKPEYEDGLYVAEKYNDMDYWVLKDGIWSGALWQNTYSLAETDALIKWRGPLTRVQVADDQHVLVPVVTLATNTIRSIANTRAPGSAEQAVLNAYAEAVEEAQARS